MKLTDRAVEIIYEIATSDKRQRIRLAPFGVTVFLSLVVLFVVLALWMDSYLGFRLLPPRPLNVIFSVPFLLVGFLLYIWSFRQFILYKGTPAAFYPPPAVMKTGPYAYCRNPMLSSIFLLFFGTGLLVRSVSLTFITTPLFILLNVWMTKSIEEPELVKRLGEDYLTYRSKTPMFIPRWRTGERERKR